MDLSTKQGRREQGQRIQRAVERAGLSIEELANRIGCSRALIYQYLSGSTLAQPDRLQQIATECGVTLTYFYGDTAEEAPTAADATATTPIPTDAARPLTVSPPVTAGPQEVATRLNESLRTLQELADAQEGPPDYRALASTCERILFLSAQLGDRNAEARAQFRLGNARLRVSDYPRAADALQNAITLADEIGATGIATDARQSLGTALVAMGNIAEARTHFAHIAKGEDFTGRWQGTLSLGGIHTLHGEYQQAMERFDETANLLEEAEASGQISPRHVAIGLLYVNSNRTNVYLNGGDFRGARPLAEKCLETAEALGIADQHLEARFNLAWCDFCMGRWASAFRGLSSMLQLARFVGDQGRETMARAWLGIFLAAAGDYDGAIAYGKDALSMALSRGDRRAELYAQLALADAYTGQTHRESEVRYHTNQALAVATALRLDRAEIECRLRLARLSAQTGDTAELRDAANRALLLAGRLGARHLESLAHIWLAEAERTTQAPDAAQREAARALELADEIELAEGRWRAHHLLAQVALATETAPSAHPSAGASAARSAEAESRLRTALDLLESLRTALVEAGIPDTLLENEDCVVVYALLARLLRQAGRTDDENALLDQTGWPPLNARLAADVD